MQSLLTTHSISRLCGLLAKYSQYALCLDSYQHEPESNPQNDQIICVRIITSIMSALKLIDF